MKFSALQDTLVKATAASIVTANDRLSARKQISPPNLKKSIPNLIDAVVLLGHVDTELTFKRRDVLRPNLGNEFKQACFRVMKPTTLLFGDNLIVGWG